MSSLPAVSSSIKTLADLLDRLGSVSLDRIRFRPKLGTATVQDVIDVRRDEGKLCELIEGVLLEKPVGYRESRLALFLGGLLNAFVISRNLGIVTGPDGTVELMPELVRIPDVAFTSWDRIPGRQEPADPVPHLVPNLAVEVLSRANTPGEMSAKRKDYFAAGVLQVWEIDPDARSLEVYTSPDDSRVLGPADTLDVAVIMTGFTLKVQDLFAELDRHG